MKLKDKVLVVTGAGRGLGRSHSLIAAKEGGKVVVNDVDFESAKKVVEEIKSFGGEAVPNGDTVATWDGGRSIIETALKNFGKLDILINNAAITRDCMIWKMTEQEWDEVIAVDLKGELTTTRFAVPYMREQKSGKIIFTTSSVGLKGNIGQSNYAAAKGGVVALTKSLAKELAGYNILVNCIAPRAETKVQREAVRKLQGTGALERTPDGHLKTTGNLLGWSAKPEEVSRLVIFLISDENNYITGQIIGVDGGSIWPPGLMG